MGSAQSTQSQHTEDLLNQLSGATSIPFEDGYWKELLTSFTQPLITLNPETVDARLRPYCQQLLVYNPLSHNFQALVLHTIGLLQDACDGHARTAAANAVHLINAVIQVAAESGNGSSLLLSLFHITNNLPIPKQLVDPGANQLLRLLVRRAFTSLLEISSLGNGSVVLCEVLHLLILLIAATQLGAGVHLRGPAGSHPGLEAISSQAAVKQVTCRLIALYVSRPAPVPDLLHLSAHTHTGKASTLSTVYSTASAVLWMPVTVTTMVASTVTGTPSTPKKTKPATSSTAMSLSTGTPLSPSPIGDLAGFLLLLLLHAPDQPPNAFNPFKWTLLSVRDASTVKHAEHVVAVDVASKRGADTVTHANGDVTLSDQDITLQPPTSSFPALHQALSKALDAPSILYPVESPQGVSMPQESETSETDSPIGQGLSGPTGHVGLVSSGSEEALLLLYMLLTNCPAFKSYVLHHTDQGALLLPLLRQLYDVSPQRQPHLLFLAQIVLLILSQDSAWAHTIHTVQIPHHIPWCKEQLGKGVSLGSLLILVLVRTVSISWPIGLDNGLAAPTNALAALTNLAPYCTQLHARTAQRLLALFQGLSRRFLRMGGVSSGPQALTVALSGNTAADNASPAATAQLSLAEEYLRLLLEIISLMLCGPGPEGSSPGANASEINTAGSIEKRDSFKSTGGQLNSNAALVYALLHQQEAVSNLVSHPRLGELAANLQEVIRFFNLRLDAAQKKDTKKATTDVLPLYEPSNTAADSKTSTSGWTSADQVLSILASSLSEWRPDRLKTFPRLRFKYEEEPEPDAFFVPYIWKLIVHRCGSVAWDEHHIATAGQSGQQQVEIFSPQQTSPLRADDNE